MTSEEPFYVRQTTCAKATPSIARTWFDECAAEAKAEGATWCRFSHHDIPGDDVSEILLVEGWKVQPADEGAFRYSLAFRGDAK